MKKILLIILIGIIIFTGCGKEDGEKIKYKKTNMELVDKVSNIVINDKKIFDEVNILNDNTLETKLGINRDFVIEHAIALDIYSYNPNIYIIIKPKEENKKTVKKAISLYLDSAKQEVIDEYKEIYENALIEEYNGYYICIVSDNNAEVFNKIKGYLD